MSAFHMCDFPEHIEIEQKLAKMEDQLREARRLALEEAKALAAHYPGHECGDPELCHERIQDDIQSLLDKEAGR